MRIPVLVGHSLWIVIGLLVVTGTANGQGKAKRKGAARPEDPYTGGDRELLTKLGYERYAPFVFGHGHDTNDVEHVLGLENRILWVETKHFRIGSRLGRYKIKDREERKKVRAELKVLGRKVPKIKAGTTALDPWLRLHLFAHRAEALYASFSEQLGVSDASFPKADGSPGSKQKGYMGKGPHLGLTAKYNVLLFDKASELRGYTNNFLGRSTEHSVRHYDVDSGGMLYGFAMEFAAKDFKSDTAVHCAMVYNLTHNLIDGFRCFYYPLPDWWREGVAHWHTRAIHPRYVQATSKSEYAMKAERRWNWPPRVRGRAEHGTFTPGAKLCRTVNAGPLSMVQHMQSWSRVEFLLARDRAGFGKFMHRMKNWEPTAGVALPNAEDVLKWQDEALQSAWGLDWEAMDAAWKKHVLKNYKKK